MAELFRFVNYHNLPRLMCKLDLWYTWIIKYKEKQPYYIYIYVCVSLYSQTIYPINPYIYNMYAMSFRPSLIIYIYGFIWILYDNIYMYKIYICSIDKYTCK